MTLDQDDIRKDFWTVTENKEKKWPIADGRVPSKDPKNKRGTLIGSVSIR